MCFIIGRGSLLSQYLKIPYPLYLLYIYGKKVQKDPLCLKRFDI